MPLNTGTLINSRYRIAKLIGQGGFGAVYRAWDTNLNRPCALKENLDTSQEAQRQFEREARILAGLIHPHLPRVTDHFIVPGQGQYLVMDFVEGEDLASFLARGERVTEEQALTWIGQVAEALVYLHSQPQPVIHRDIKPANIRITPEGKAMLVDFGLVKVYDVHLKTTVGARAVTPGYSPPEQYGRGATDHRTDIYALAATLYTLLTDQEPTESIQRVVGDPLVRVDTLNPQVSSHLALVLEQAMALNPSQRYQSAKEFVSVLSPSTHFNDKVVAGKTSPPQEIIKGANQLPIRRAHIIKAWVVSRWLPLSGILLVGLLAGVLLFFPKNTQLSPDDGATSDMTTSTTELVNADETETAVGITTASNRLEIIEAETGLTVLSAQPVFGPENGSLVHSANERIEVYWADIDLTDFLVEVTFSNPYSRNLGSWDYGFFLGNDSDNEQLRLMFFSNQTWQLAIRSGAKYTPFDFGEISVLRNFDNQSNHIVWHYQNNQGTFYVNGELIDTFELSSRRFPGGIGLATGIFAGNKISTQSTEFSNFTVWSLP